MISAISQERSSPFPSQQCLLSLDKQGKNAGLLRTLQAESGLQILIVGGD